MTFADQATAVVDRYLASEPVDATYLGDHRYDDLLPDLSPEAAADRAAAVRADLDALATLAGQPAEDAVDAAILDTGLRAQAFELEQLREAEWNPMLGNPGNAVHALLSREFAPRAERFAAARRRLAAVPEFLAGARRRLLDATPIHTETALLQLEGTLGLLDDPELGESAQAARAAIATHRDWLAEHRPAASRDPRIGPELFAAKLALTLDTAFDPAALLARAEVELAETTTQIVDAAGRLVGRADADPNTVRELLDELGAEVASDATILAECRSALHELTAFVLANDLITVAEDEIAVVEMPEIDRGVAVAYCRPVGALETAPLPTEIAVSPTPQDWTQAQVASFYREYNLHMLQNLMAHEAMPGHALQLAHARRFTGSSPARAVFWSGSFVEGWAVYSEQLMALHGYRNDVSPRAAAALRLHQLKMALRMLINTIMDIRYHCDDLDQAAAMELMMGRGFQEEGEALGKWRRVQLTSTQLCTYYVGFSEVRDLLAELRAARPAATERELHDAILAHGSPPVRHLRTLLGLV